MDTKFNPELFMWATLFFTLSAALSLLVANSPPVVLTCVTTSIVFYVWAKAIKVKSWWRFHIGTSFGIVMYLVITICFSAPAIEHAMVKNLFEIAQMLILVEVTMVLFAVKDGPKIIITRSQSQYNIKIVFAPTILHAKAFLITALVSYMKYKTNEGAHFLEYKGLDKATAASLLSDFKSLAWHKMWIPSEDLK